MKKRTLFIGGILIVTALGYAFWPFGSKQGGPDGKGQAVPVTVMRMQTEKTTLHEELPGRIVAFKVAEIRPQVGGIVTNRLFEEGSDVKQGQQLYQIDPAPYQAAYDSAKANLSKAEANVLSVSAKSARYEELVKIEAVSKQDYDDIRASLSQANADVAIAKAAMAQAKISLNYTKVYAPISGRIGKSSVTTGALVTASQPEALAQITQLDPVYVDMTQSSAQMMRMRAHLEDGKEAPVALFLEGEKTPYAHEGKLQFTEVTVDPTTGSVLLRALFPNPDGTLLPGLFVRAQIKLKEEDSLLVPQKAATRSPDGSLSVWVVDGENKVAPRPVSAEKAIGDKWLVKDGVQVGDIIVLEGFQKITPGATVMSAFEGEAPDQAAKEPAKKPEGH